MKKTLLICFVCLIFSFSIHAQTIVGNWKLTWIVIELDMAYSIIVPITLSIEENGKISGNGGCNSFTGNYSFKKPKKPFKKPVKIKFSEIISTKLPCEKPLKTENVFFRSLRDANTIFIKDGELFIESSKQGNSMSFIREVKSVAASLDLPGTNLIKIQNPNAKPIDLRFSMVKKNFSFAALVAGHQLKGE